MTTGMWIVTVEAIVGSLVLGLVIVGALIQYVNLKDEQDRLMEERDKRLGSDNPNRKGLG